jgi:protein-tyrosine phosphatase
MSRLALEALEAKAIVPEGVERCPRPCARADFDHAELIIALKEAEHRPLIERRFPEFASIVTYWHVDDIAFAHPSTTFAVIDAHVHELISNLRLPAAR